jgi:hypothetical protein
MTAQQLRELSVAAVFGGALAALGIGAILAGNWLKADATKRELQVRRQALDASGRLARANDESQQIGAYQERYNRYLKINAIRPNTNARSGQNAEQGERLDWIERVVEAREAQALPSAVYSIAARKPYDQGVAISPGWSLQASRMKLELGLVHEGDFINYLRRLANPPAGIFQIDHCTIQGSKTLHARPPGRAPDARSGSTSSAGTNANLSAICEIDWITLIEDAQPAAGTPARTGR